MSNHPHQRPNGFAGTPMAVNVTPAPLPLQMVCQQAEVNGTTMVLLTMLSPGGQAVYFLPLDAAKWLAGELSAKATPITLAK